MKEVWKDLPGYEGAYQVSSEGRVKSLPRKCTVTPKRNRSIRERILLPSDSTSGYLRVSIGRNNALMIHRLVSITFIPNPENKRCVNHKDCNKHNNHLSNLEWVTDSENRRHGGENGLYDNFPKGAKHHNSKLNAGAVIHIRQKTLSQNEYAELYGVGQSTISVIQMGKSWRHIA